MVATHLAIDSTTLSERENAVLDHVLDRFASTAEWVSYRSIERAFPYEWEANLIAVRLADIGLLEDHAGGVRPTLRGVTRKQELFRDLLASVDNLLRAARDAYAADHDFLADGNALFPADEKLRRKLHLTLRGLSTYVQIASAKADGTIVRLELRPPIRGYTTLAAMLQPRIEGMAHRAASAPASGAILSEHSARPMLAREVRGSIDFAVITIKQEEFAAALAQFGATAGHVAQGARDYALASVPRTNGAAAIAAITRCPSQGNGVAQDVARDVISDLDPQWILVVGIAGAAPTEEFGLGDVVLASQVLDFSVEAVKADSRAFAVEGRSLDPRAENFVSTVAAHATALGLWHELSTNPFGSPRVPLERPPINPKGRGRITGGTAHARAVRAALRWQAERPHQAPMVFPAPIAASDRLVKDPELLELWQIVARHVRAIEMESAGVHLAARGRGEHRKGYPAMSVRGISDIIGLQRDERWTQYACISAAAFAYAFARLSYVQPRGTLRFAPWATGASAPPHAPGDDAGNGGSASSPNGSRVERRSASPSASPASTRPTLHTLSAEPSDVPLSSPPSTASPEVLLPPPPAPPAGYLRVAVIQLAFVPSAAVEQFHLLEQPATTSTTANWFETHLGNSTRGLRDLQRHIGKKIRAIYVEHETTRLRELLKTCSEWGVQVLVLPEYSVAPECLELILPFTQGMTAVLGTHSVEPSLLDSGFYAKFPLKAPLARTSVAPVAIDGALRHLQPKLNATHLETGMINGQSWDPVMLPSSQQLGILTCLDFLKREGSSYRTHVGDKLDNCSLVAVPSLTPHYTVERFDARAVDESKGYARSVLYADIANGGGTSIYVASGMDRASGIFPYAIPSLAIGEEGIIVADLDVEHTRTAEKTSRSYSDRRAVIPVAASVFRYRSVASDAHHIASVGAVLRDCDLTSRPSLNNAIDQHSQLLSQLADASTPTAAATLNAAIEMRGAARNAEDLLCQLRYMPFSTAVLPLSVVESLRALAALDEAEAFEPARTEEEGAARLRRRLRELCGEPT